MEGVYFGTSLEVVDSLVVVFKFEVAEAEVVLELCVFFVDFFCFVEGFECAFEVHLFVEGHP